MISMDMHLISMDMHRSFQSDGVGRVWSTDRLGLRFAD
jgi:hypothetical protein